MKSQALHPTPGGETPGATEALDTDHVPRELKNLFEEPHNLFVAEEKAGGGEKGHPTSPPSRFPDQVCHPPLPQPLFVLQACLAADGEGP